MKNFIDIYEEGNIILPNSIAFKRVQRYHSPISIPFILDKESELFLKSALGLQRVYFPTLKKIAENILILNDMFYNHEKQIVLMNNIKYHYHQELFNYKPREIQ